MRNTKNKGFSLTEVLTTVAILVILFGLMSVAIVRYAKTTKQTRLDKMAETVYLSAQNNLTKLNTAGRIGEVKYGQTGIYQLADNPGDYKGSDTRTFEYVSSIDNPEVAELFVSSDAIDKGYEFFIEYDAESGDVYSAFVYQDTSIKAFYPSTADNYRGDREDRITNGNNIGYYKGEIRSIITTETDKITCDTKVVNKEVLEEIIYVNMPEGDKYKGHKVALEITVKGTKSNKIKTIAYDEKNPTTIVGFYPGSSANPSIREYTLVLDELKSGLSFAEQYSGFYPGEDIEISVIAKDVDDNNVAASTPISDTVNSLYAKLEERDSSSYTATITYARHLENLNAFTDTSKNIYAVQNRDIDYTKGSPTVLDGNAFSVEEANNYYSIYGTRKHVPITRSSIYSYNGAGYYISNLNAGADPDGNSGLFGTFYGRMLSGIILRDADVNGTNFVGALAGAIDSNGVVVDQISINKCYSYLTNPSDDDVYVSGNTCGGLVGTITSNANAINITKSFASTIISANNTAGGLIGTTNKNININNAYADSYISGNIVGGLAGSLGSSSIIGQSYAAGFLVGDATTVAGITPSSIGSINHSYTVFSSNGSDKITNKHSTVGGGSISYTYYLKMDGVTNQKGEEKTTADFIDAKNKLSLGDSFLYDNNSVYPYNLYGLHLDDDKYPYPAIINDVAGIHSSSILNHYGDWEETEQEKYIVSVRNINGNNEEDYYFEVGIDQLFKIDDPSDSTTQKNVIFWGWTIVDMDGSLHTLMSVDGTTRTLNDTTLEMVFENRFKHLRENDDKAVTFYANWEDKNIGKITFYSDNKESTYDVKFGIDGKRIRSFEANGNADLDSLDTSLNKLKQDTALQEGYKLTGWMMEILKKGSPQYSKDIDEGHCTVNVSDDGTWTYDVDSSVSNTVSVKSGSLRITGLGGIAVNFYPKYDLVEYPITYNLYGGANNADNPDTYNIQDTVTFKPATYHDESINADRVFGGWWYGEGEEPYATKTEGISKLSTGARTVNALWSNKITFSTNVQGVTIAGSPIDAIYKNKINANNVSINRTIIGWRDANNTIVFNSNGTPNIGNTKYFDSEGNWIYKNDLEVFASYYQLTLRSDLGDIVIDTAALDGKNTLIGAKTVTNEDYVAPDKSDLNYVFDGWYLKNGNSYTKIINGNGTINENAKNIAGYTSNGKFSFNNNRTLIAGYKETLEDVYVNVDSISNNKKYLITNKNTAGSAYIPMVTDSNYKNALGANIGKVLDKEGVTIKAPKDAKRTIIDYTGNNYWTSSSSYFYNSAIGKNKYLAYDNVQKGKTRVVYAADDYDYRPDHRKTWNYLSSANIFYVDLAGVETGVMSYDDDNGVWVGSLINFTSSYLYEFTEEYVIDHYDY